LSFVMEVSENGVKNSISGEDVVFIKVVVIGCLLVYVEALY